MWPVCFSLLIVDVVATVLPPCRTSSLFNPKPVQSAAKKANCVTGITDVTVSANNTKILYSGPADNMAATELFVEIDQINSTVLTTINGGNTLIHGTYSIYSKLCFPANIAPTEEVETIQFLTHGGTLDNTYWDLAPGYSYVDAAADAGYATFSYDRLGTGKSDHPDPIQVVQLPLQVEIAHALVQMLRTTHIAGHRFKKVVGVGHSLGSGLSQGVTTAYPNDFDAVILTGTSASFAFAPLGTASTAQQIANTDPSGRFANLANGYVVPAPVPQSIQFAFYRYPHFDPRSKSSAILLSNVLTLLKFSAPRLQMCRPMPLANFLPSAMSIPHLPTSRVLSTLSLDRMTFSTVAATAYIPEIRLSQF